MINRLKNKVLKTGAGLRKLPKDKNDFKLGALFGFDYEPKYERKSLKPLSVKKQLFNTCGWTSSVGGKEIDEGCLLSPRGFVLIGKFLGYISGDGFSNLRDNEKAMQKMGVPEMGLMPEEAKTWSEYSDLKFLTEKVKQNAAKHKSKTYWSISDVKEVYQQLDNERWVKVGVDWYYGLNMDGGFSFPWLWKAIKWLVGGHAMYVMEYILDYNGKRVFALQNSFGIGYGDEGKLYIEERDLQKQINRYGCFVNLDEDIDLGKWLVDNQGRVVRKEGDPKVYLIQGNKKRWYPDPPTLFVHGKSFADVELVDADILDKITEGDQIEFKDGGNVDDYKNAVKYDGQLKKLFNKYF